MKTMIFILWTVVAGYLIPIEKAPSIFDADDEIVFASSWERSITNDPDNFDIWKVVPFNFQLDK